MDPRNVTLIAGAALGYGVLMLANPVRSSLRDGFLCVRRYSQIWMLPATFAVSHALFRLWVRWYESRTLPAAPPFAAAWTGWNAFQWSAAAAASWLPAAENVAGLFNCLVDTFPLSAPAALLFLCNWRGYQSSLFRALSRRAGLPGAIAVHAGLLACACAAMVKPALFGTLPKFNAYLGADALQQAGEIVNWLSFIFEYLMSVGCQIYLILLCYVWLRGLRFDFDELRRFALRRFSFVMKWSAVILIVSTLGISAPTIFASFRPEFGPEASARMAGVLTFSRWALAALIMAAFSIQITLTFHNESLRRAFADHIRFLRRCGSGAFWFGATAFIHLFLLALVNAAMLHGLPSGAWPVHLWNLVYPVAWAIVAGWLLASWVALFRRCHAVQQPEGGGW